ncbi:MAG TPA: PilZ domain-containing protein [Terriglobales bacterium]
MEKPLRTIVAPIPVITKKASARAALVNIKEPAGQIIAECFRQFGVEAIPVGGDAPERLKKEKFDACILRLDPSSEPVMETVRTSPSNQRMVIYGLGGSAQEAMKFSKYGINAMFHEPIDRSSALKLVRATHMLVLHEFRRYVRVPIMTEVSVTRPNGSNFIATSREISAGGMSLESPEELTPGTQIEISFSLLTLPRIWVKGTVNWKKLKSFGVRFDAQDERRARLKGWIEGYTGN